LCTLALEVHLVNCVCFNETFLSRRIWVEVETFRPEDREGEHLLSFRPHTFVREMLDRFDGPCERNLTEMISMEWERNIEAGTSVLHDDNVFCLFLQIKQKQRYIPIGYSLW
jgi:hypothetical protein